VAPVTRGERLAAVTWVQSQVRDPARREILYDLYRMREKLAKLHPDDDEADLAFKTHANLLRMWCE
jgi:PKHD-type hydroxylase